jgi:hypothetical protein
MKNLSLKHVFLEVPLSVVAVVSLAIFFSQGRNAVWGGATAGLIVAFVIALSKDGFDWSIILKGAVIGTLIGVGAELLGRLSGHPTSDG